MSHGRPDVASSAGIVVINPLSFSRRVHVDVSGPRLPARDGRAVLRAGEEAGRKSIVVEVPPVGFVCVVPGSGRAPAQAPRRLGLGLFRKAPPPPPPMAELVLPAAAPCCGTNSSNWSSIPTRAQSARSSTSIPAHRDWPNRWPCGCRDPEYRVPGRRRRRLLDHGGR